jgi:hypothetical protein
MDGNYRLMSGTSPWWDGVTGKDRQKNLSSSRPVSAKASPGL